MLYKCAHAYLTTVICTNKPLLNQLYVCVCIMWHCGGNARVAGSKLHLHELQSVFLPVVIVVVVVAVVSAALWAVTWRIADLTA